MSDLALLRCDDPVTYKRRPGVVTTYRLRDGQQICRVRLTLPDGSPGEAVEGPAQSFQRVPPADPLATRPIPGQA